MATGRWTPIRLPARTSTRSLIASPSTKGLAAAADARGALLVDQGLGCEIFLSIDGLRGYEGRQCHTAAMRRTQAPFPVPPNG